MFAIDSAGSTRGLASHSLVSSFLFLSLSLSLSIAVSFSLTSQRGGPLMSACSQRVLSSSHLIDGALLNFTRCNGVFNCGRDSSNSLTRDVPRELCSLSLSLYFAALRKVQSKEQSLDLRKEYAQGYSSSMEQRKINGDFVFSLSLSTTGFSLIFSVISNSNCFCSVQHAPEKTFTIFSCSTFFSAFFFFSFRCECKA